MPGRTPSQICAGLSQFRWKSASRSCCRGHVFCPCSFSWPTIRKSRAPLPAGSAARTTRPGPKERRRTAHAVPRPKPLKRPRRDRRGRRYRARRPRFAYLEAPPRHGPRRRPHRRRKRRRLEGVAHHRPSVVRGRHAHALRDPHRRRLEPPTAQGDTPPRRPNRNRDPRRHRLPPTAARSARTDDRRPPRCCPHRPRDRRRHRRHHPRRAPLRRRQAQARTPPARQ